MPPTKSQASSTERPKPLRNRILQIAGKPPPTAAFQTSSRLTSYRRPLKPREVSALIEALYWPAKYSVVELPTATRILNLWLRCKVYRGNFDKVIEHRREFSRATAYRYRDKALAAIAIGLERDGVPTP